MVWFHEKIGYIHVKVDISNNASERERDFCVPKISGLTVKEHQGYYAYLQFLEKCWNVYSYAINDIFFAIKI